MFDLNAFLNPTPPPKPNFNLPAAELIELLAEKSDYFFLILGDKGFYLFLNDCEQQIYHLISDGIFPAACSGLSNYFSYNTDWRSCVATNTPLLAAGSIYLYTSEISKKISKAEAIDVLKQSVVSFPAVINEYKFES